MKIKLVILENDEIYLSRLKTVFETKYADKFQVSVFTDKACAYAELTSKKIDFLLSAEDFEIDEDKIPERCAFAYLIETPGVDKYLGKPAICKFQKVDIICSMIFSIYSNVATGIEQAFLKNDGCQVILFTSPAGGVGTSVMAVGCSKFFSANGLKTLYFNAEETGDSSIYFTSEGNFDFGELIFAIKSKKANLGMKIESCLRQDISGVYYFAPTKYILDMNDLSIDEMVEILTKAKDVGGFDRVVIDCDYGFQSDKVSKLCKLADKWIVVSDGSVTANNKIERIYSSVEIAERNGNESTLEKMKIVYNKYDSNICKPISKPIESVTSINVPKYSGAEAVAIADAISNSGCFANLM